MNKVKKNKQMYEKKQTLSEKRIRTNNLIKLKFINFKNYF